MRNCRLVADGLDSHWDSASDSPLANPREPRTTAQLRRLAADVQAVSTNPLDGAHALDLLNTSYATPFAAAARARLKADPSIRPLIQERYWEPWPSLVELQSQPEGSLGHTLGQLLADQGLLPLPDPVIPAGADGDDIYLQLRIRHTHDLWHAVTGFPTNLAGEAGLNGFTCEQLRWPGSALLLAADLIHRVNEDGAHSQDNGVDVGRAVAFGLELGATASPFLAQRWEQGWHRPLQEWRDALGLSPSLMARSPFAVDPPCGNPRPAGGQTDGQQPIRVSKASPIS
jgi:ubiquinone biosynthesis protein Coq4